MSAEDRIKELEKRLAELEPDPALLRINGKSQSIISRSEIRAKNKIINGKSGSLYHNTQTNTYTEKIPVIVVEDK